MGYRLRWFLSLWLACVILIWSLLWIERTDR